MAEFQNIKTQAWQPDGRRDLLHLLANPEESSASTKERAPVDMKRIRNQLQTKTHLSSSSFPSAPDIDLPSVKELFHEALKLSSPDGGGQIRFSIWDFAGQPVFYDLLQILITP
jgi:GTPase SAR1 family protein